MPAPPASRTSRSLSADQLVDLPEIHHVPVTVDRFAELVDLQLAARRRVVTAGSRSLDDKAVDLAVGSPQHRHCQHIGGDDGEKSWAYERRVIALHEIPRIKPCERLVAGSRTDDVQWVGRGLVMGKAVEDAGDHDWDSRTHYHVSDTHVSDTSQHGAVDGRKVGHLDLLQIVDTDGAVVSFASQKDLHKIAQDAQLVELF